MLSKYQCECESEAWTDDPNNHQCYLSIYRPQIVMRDRQESSPDSSHRIWGNFWVRSKAIKNQRRRSSFHGSRSLAQWIYKCEIYELKAHILGLGDTYTRCTFMTTDNDAFNAKKGLLCWWSRHKWIMRHNIQRVVEMGLLRAPMDEGLFTYIFVLYHQIMSGSDCESR
jgi:hypothetical protein